MSKSYQNFLTDLDNNKSPATKKVYVERFTDFCQYAGINSADLLTQIEKAKFEDQVKDYIDARKAVGKGYSFLNQAVSAIRYFCLSNRIDLNFAWLFNKVPKPEVRDEENRQDVPYTKEQIELLTGTADKDLRLVVSMAVMWAGGARVGALPGMKIQHLQFVDKYDLYGILTYPNSKEYRYWTVLTPQVSKWIDRLKRDRKEGWLFQSKTESGSGVKKGALVNDIWRLTIKAGVRVVNHKGDNLTRHPVMLDHGFRKFHSTTLERAGLRDEQIAHLRGKKDKLAKVYQIPQLIEVIENNQYPKAIPFLAIQT